MVTVIVSLPLVPSISTAFFVLSHGSVMIETLLLGGGGGGAMSSFLIVPVAVGVLTVAPVAPVRFTWNVSSDSTFVSPFTVTVKVFVASPDAKLSTAAFAK